MPRARQPHPLRLVHTPRDRARMAELELWLLGPAPDPLPDEAALIARLEGVPPCSEKQIEETIETLVAAGQLHRVHIGPRRHLTRIGRAADQHDDDEAAFRLQVALDLEAEKQLLFKTVLALEAIALLVVVRDIVLRWLAG